MKLMSKEQICRKYVLLEIGLWPRTILMLRSQFTPSGPTIISSTPETDSWQESVAFGMLYAYIEMLQLCTFYGPFLIS